MSRTIVAIAIAIAIAIAAGVGALELLDSGSDGGEAAAERETRELAARARVPGASAAPKSVVRTPAARRLLASAPEPLAAPAPDRAPDPGDGHLVVRIRAGSAVTARARPRGRILARLGDRTDLGSRNALAVIEMRQRGRWLGVATPALAHGRLGWIRADARRISYARTRRALHVDISARRLELREGNRVLRRATVGVGRGSTPTPTGRFGVTDRLLGTDFGFWYGCCIIAFSARQPHLPPGWEGGNRIAVHGTNAPATIGAASTAGCLRAGDAVLRDLMLEVPLGTPVLIRD